MAWSGYIADLVAVAGFELGGAEVSQVLCSRVPLYQPMYSVTARRTPALVGQACRSMSSPLASRRAFGEGVVPALAGVPCERLDLAVRREVANSADVYWQPRSEWNITPVPVAGGDRISQRIRDQPGAQVISHRVADDAAGGDVDDRCQVQPPLPCRDVDIPRGPGVKPPSGWRRSSGRSRRRLRPSSGCCRHHHMRPRSLFARLRRAALWWSPAARRRS